MIKSIKIKPGQSEEFEAVCPADRVVEVSGDWLCYLADMQFLINPDMIQSTVWEDN